MTDIPVEEAIARFYSVLASEGLLGTITASTVSLSEAKGRISAKPIWATNSSPDYDAAAMDGIAVRANDTIGATDQAPVRLTLEEGFYWVDTGDVLPSDCDAVIMIEVVKKIDDRTVEILTPVPPNHHIRPMGEDIVAAELLLPEGHILRSVDIGACAAAGLSNVLVRNKPQVALIPTGTELVTPGSAPRPGEIVEFNTLIMAGMVEEWGGIAVRYQPIPDKYEQLRQTILDACSKHDIVVINAGSSAGHEDYTARIIEDLGHLIVHGVAIRPGHPAILGLIQDKPVLGIPGYPVSAVLTCELFLKNLLEKKLGVKLPSRPRIKATLSRKISSTMGESEYIRVRAGKVGDKTVATPIQRGAGAIMSLVRADGILTIERFSEGLQAGQEIEIELLRSEEEILNTIVSTGSHDIALDLLSNQLRKRDPGLSLASSNVGSLGGLIALARGEAHIAGSHLLDEKTGEYNIPFIRRHLADHSVHLVNLVYRQQGLIVPKGNPRDIHALEDISLQNITFVNRQRGSGTRILLDYNLKQKGISSGTINGYEREVYTHLAVAACISSGAADVGLGIHSAAMALDLDFVPLLTEQYDLVIPTKFYESELLSHLLYALNEQDFRSQVGRLGGYDTSRMGEVLTIIDSNS